MAEKWLPVEDVETNTGQDPITFGSLIPDRVVNMITSHKTPSSV